MCNRAWKWLFLVTACAAGVVAVVVLTLFLTHHKQVLPLPAPSSSGFLPAAFSQARRIQHYFQPPQDLVQAISRVYGPDDFSKVDQVIRDSKGRVEAVIVDHVPFFPYWQGPEDQYAFHPMGYGGFLSSLPCDKATDFLAAAERTACELPNGGLLWYYPDNYNLNRFLGPDISPSAIGQAQILGAIVDLDRRCGLGLSDLARRAFLGLAFPYYRGGVNLENKFLLEFPLFRSAPEVILNGWLHALLYLRQYAEFYRDPEAKELFLSNVSTLARVLPSFHDPATGLSLYSDLCPYRVRIHHPDGPPRALYAFYSSREQDLDDLVFELKPIEGDRSSYDNRIIRSTPNYTVVWISCSQRYDTYLVAEGSSFTAEFATGTYDPHRATPAGGGEDIALQSETVGDYSVVHITSVRDKLFCGYPTNFSKLGKNYYHVYHVVALACLLASADLPEEVRESFGYWMRKWMKTVEDWQDNQELQFYDYQFILDDLHEHKACLLTDNWNTLFAKAASQE